MNVRISNDACGRHVTFSAFGNASCHEGYCITASGTRNAKAALSDFVNRSNLTAPQLRFIDLLVNHLVHHGVVEVEDLFEAPFTDLHSEGVTGLFGEEAGLIRDAYPHLGSHVAGLTRLIPLLLWAADKWGLAKGNPNPPILLFRSLSFLFCTRTVASSYQTVWLNEFHLKMVESPDLSGKI